MLPSACGLGQGLGHSFSLYGPPSRQITYIYKQLLDEVFVSVRVMLSRPWLFWISQKPNLIIVLLHIGRNKKSHVFASSLMASTTKRVNLTWLPSTSFPGTFPWPGGGVATKPGKSPWERGWITLRNMHNGHTWHYYPWPWVSLTWLLYNLQLWRHVRWFRKFTVRFRSIRKEIVSSMYNNDNKPQLHRLVYNWLSVPRSSEKEETWRVDTSVKYLSVLSTGNPLPPSPHQQPYPL